MSQRGFQILAMVTALFTIAALWAVLTDEQAVAPQSDPKPAFVGLKDQRKAIENITISAKGSVLALRRSGKAPWRVRSSDGYPADQAVIARLISAMESLVLLEPRTRRPSRFGQLNLDDPAAGNEAVGIQLMDREESALAGLILGSAMRPPTPDRPGRFHVRLTGENQAWLAEGRLIAPSGTRIWLDQNMGLPADSEIRSIEVFPFEGPSYRMDRETAEASIAFRDLPEGRRLINPSAPMQLAQSLAFLTIEDARSRPGELPKAASITQFKTFDDRTLKIMQWAADGQPWMAIDLEGDWSAPLRDRSEGYIFRLSKARARSLSAPLETLLIPPG